MSLFGFARFAHFLAPAAVARFLALRSKVTRSTKRDANGKVISIKMNGGDLMMSVEWIDAPACTVYRRFRNRAHSGTASH